jgi:hypothetical protein
LEYCWADKLHWRGHENSSHHTVCSGGLLLTDAPAGAAMVLYPTLRGTLPLCTLIPFSAFFFLIEAKFTQPKINHFKMNNPVASVLSVLHNYLFSRPQTFSSLQRKCWVHSIVTPPSFFLPAPGNHQSALCFYGFGITHHIARKVWWFVCPCLSPGFFRGMFLRFIYVVASIVDSLMPE